jgi:hypothetical protein
MHVGPPRPRAAGELLGKAHSADGACTALATSSGLMCSSESMALNRPRPLAATTFLGWPWRTQWLSGVAEPNELHPYMNAQVTAGAQLEEPGR